MNLYAFITARCSSSRFPNKTISMLGGRPMLEQIIMKAKKLKGLDGIVVSTSYLTSDNPIQDICEVNNVECYRGENHNLASRHLETWNTYGLTHILSLSGDSPFFSMLMAQRFIDAIREKPEAWAVAMSIPWGDTISGHCAGIQKREYLDMQLEVFKKCDDPAAMEEHYWVCLGGLEEDDPRVIKVDCSDIIHPSVTAIKIDIDYPLEMVIMNKVIDHLEYFPECYGDIERAYKEIVKL